MAKKGTYCWRHAPADRKGGAWGRDGKSGGNGFNRARLQNNRMEARASLATPETDSPRRFSRFDLTGGKGARC